MKAPAASVLIICAISSALAQTLDLRGRTATFTDLAGKVYTQVVLVKADAEGIIYRVPEGAGGGRVRYTNLAPEVLQTLGVPTNRIALAVEKAKADQALRAAAAPVQLTFTPRNRDSIGRYLYQIRPISAEDFPTNLSGQIICKEIVSELKAINTVLELGVSYTKFCDLLQDKVLSVQKIVDLRGEALPYRFLHEVEDTIDAYKSSKRWWSDKIEAEYPGSKALDECFMREYWSEGDLHFLYCTGIAEKDTNVNAMAILQVAAMIRAEQDSVIEKIRPPEDCDPAVSALTTREIAERLRAKLSTTNAPAR